MPHLTPGSASPTWERYTEIPGVVLHRPNLRRTTTIAVAVGTILFLINQLDTVLQRGASATVAVKAMLDVVVPFCVSNLGVLVATRRQRG